MANALLGCDPLGNDCMFGVCGGMDSCTKNTTIGSGQWLGVADSFSVSLINICKTDYQNSYSRLLTLRALVTLMALTTS